MLRCSSVAWNTQQRHDVTSCHTEASALLQHVVEGMAGRLVGRFQCHHAVFAGRAVSSPVSQAPGSFQFLTIYDQSLLLLHGCF